MEPGCQHRVIQRENLPTSPSNGTETDALMMPMGQMPHTTRFGSNQIIAERALWIPMCPNCAHSPATYMDWKAPTPDRTLVSAKEVEPDKDRGTGQEQV